MPAKKKTAKKVAKKVAKKKGKRLPEINGKSLAAGEKKEEPVIEKKKRQIQNEMNLPLIQAIKDEMRKKEFSLGQISKKMHAPFQKVRYFAIRLAAKQGKSLVRLSRGNWTVE